MKIIMAQPAMTRFEWEIATALTNLEDLGFDTRDVVLLFSKHDAGIPARLHAAFGCEVHVYEDTREYLGYIPSIKPFLWWQYLQEDKTRENETYYYTDSDVIMRELPDFARIIVQASPRRWIAADCSGYLSQNYIKHCENGDTLKSSMLSVIGIDQKLLCGKEDAGPGAQWLMVKPTAEYWRDVYYACGKLYLYLNTQRSNIQKWTAEMWAQYWLALDAGVEILANDEFAFCWPTDPISKWPKHKLLHDAGVHHGEDMFCKSDYIRSYPWDSDMSYVNGSKCSIMYVKALQKAGRRYGDK